MSDSEKIMRSGNIFVVGLTVIVFLPGCSSAWPQAENSKVSPLRSSLVRQETASSARQPTAKREVLSAQPSKSSASNPSAAVYAAVSPDGRLGASFYGSGKVGLWNIQTGKRLRTFKYGRVKEENYQFGGTAAFTFSRSGKWLLIEDNYSVSLGEAQPRHDADVMTVWNTANGHEIPTPIPDDDDSINCFAFTLDDGSLVYDCIGKFGTSCSLCKVDLNTGRSKMLNIFHNDGDVNYGCHTQFTPDGKFYMASGFGPDRTINTATFQSAAWSP